MFKTLIFLNESLDVLVRMLFNDTDIRILIRTSGITINLFQLVRYLLEYGYSDSEMGTWKNDLRSFLLKENNVQIGKIG